MEKEVCRMEGERELQPVSLTLTNLVFNTLLIGD